MSTSIVERFPTEPFIDISCELFLLREDRNHPLIGGNKWRKLKYNLSYARSQGFIKLISIGGAYSNHLYALAAIGKEYGFETIGIVREPDDDNNPTLRFLRAQGMQVHYVSRTAYRNIRSADGMEDLQKQYNDAYFIPEGGSNDLAIRGCREIVTLFPEDSSVVAVPCGTGCTLAGIIEESNEITQVIGFSALKENFLEREVGKFLSKPKSNWRIERGYHFGGIGAYDTKLIEFLNNLFRITSLQLDPIYNGKMIYGLLEMLRNGQLDPTEKILAIITGGKQGVEGFQYRHGKLLDYP